MNKMNGMNVFGYDSIGFYENLMGNRQFMYDCKW